MRADERTGVVGIGYEGTTIDGLILTLRNEGVQTLFDVRLNASSRKPGFSKRALAASLAEAGIDYVHLRELGNARDNRDGYSEPLFARGVEVRKRYELALTAPHAAAAVKVVRKTATAQKVAVFCFEESTEFCHRSQIIEAIARTQSSQSGPMSAADVPTSVRG